MITLERSNLTIHVNKNTGLPERSNLFIKIKNPIFPPHFYFIIVKFTKKI
jgi:hypothetical protein